MFKLSTGSVSFSDISMIGNDASDHQEKVPRLSRTIQHFKNYINLHRVSPHQDKTVKPSTTKVTSKTDASQKGTTKHKKVEHIFQTETSKVHEKTMSLVTEQTSTKTDSTANQDSAVEQDIIAPFTPPAIQKPSPTASLRSFSNGSFCTSLDTINEAHEESEDARHELIDTYKGGKRNGTVKSEGSKDSSKVNASNDSFHRFGALDQDISIPNGAYLSASYRNNIKYATMVNSHSTPSILTYKPLPTYQQEDKRSSFDLAFDAEIEAHADAFIKRLEMTFARLTAPTLKPKEVFSEVHPIQKDDDSSNYFDSDDDYMPKTPADDLYGAFQAHEPVMSVENDGGEKPTDEVALNNVSVVRPHGDVSTSLTLKSDNNEASAIAATTLDRSARYTVAGRQDNITALDEALRQYVPKVPTKTLTQCKVNRIINNSSAKEYNYELFLQHNHKTLATYTGVINKLTETSSAATIIEEPITIEDLEWPFLFHLLVTAKKCRNNSTARVRQAFTRFNSWNHKLFSSTKKSASIKKTHIVANNIDGDNDDEKVMTSPTGAIAQYRQPAHKLRPIGHSYMIFDDYYRRNIVNQGEYICKIIPENRRSRNPQDIEVSLTFQEQQVLPFISRPFQSPVVVEQDGRKYSTVSASHVATNRLLDTVSIDRRAQQHCERGDYLTIYSKGSVVPFWTRYWVVLHGAYLVAYDFAFKDEHEPVAVIPLMPLLTVEQSQMADCEEYGLVRNTSLTLNFQKGSAVLAEKYQNWLNEDISTLPLTDTLKPAADSSKLFIHCDDERSLEYWRTSINACLKRLPNNVSYSEGVDAAFLW